MSYIGKAKEDPKFIGRNDLGRDKPIDAPTTILTSDGTIGPYTLPHHTSKGVYNSTDRENQIDVWVGGVYQNSSSYAVNGLTLTFDSAPNINQKIVVKYRVVKLDEGQLAKKSVGNTGLADDAITLAKMKQQTKDGFLGWDETGAPGIISEPGNGLQNRLNIAMNSFKIARNNGLSIKNMADGIADEYTDASGIDSGNSVNQTLTSGYFSGGISDMTLQSTPTLIDIANPATGYIIISHEFVADGNLNSDIVADISRDGGSTWSRVALSTVATDTQAAGINLLSGIVDLRGQPTGSSMVYRIKTLNVEQRVHACSLQWRY